jgi:acetyltransferase-like isoleucine patch superfamily enzyme
MTDPFIHPTVNLGEDIQIGNNSRVWSNSQIGSGVRIGAWTTIGRNVYLGPGTFVGNSCKIQNNALLYEPALIKDGVFVGPGAILTNDKFPRAINPDGTIKGIQDWEQVGVQIEYGASIGAGAVCVAPVTIGEWAVVAAGSVVLSDVSPFALVAGTPARRIGWVGKAGIPLKSSGESFFLCPKTNDVYFEKPNGKLTAIIE